jgi:hypothetical protein
LLLRFRVQEEIMNKTIGVVALGAALALGVATGASAQSAGGAATPGAGVGANSMGGATGGRVTPPTPNLNSSTPNTVPQSNEAPVSPATPNAAPGSGLH